MSFNLIRLTLYGLIVAIDTDLRSLVKSQLGDSKSLSDFVPPDVVEKIKDRAQRDGLFDDGDCYEYLDFSDSIKILNASRTSLDPTVVKFLKSSSQDFDKIIAVRNRVMHARPLHFTDYSTVDTFVRNVVSYPRHFFPNVAEFEERVRDNPNFVYSLDLSQVGTAADRIPHNLPLPDYDETGFLGREQEASDLIAACKSNWPVVTVVGEGGLGKSALALKVAYELLDDETSGFEAIVWATAKRTVLTLDDIQTIDGAIQDSLGLIKCAASQLGANTDETLVMDEVASYLNSFKILLILDNLETVLDPLLTRFIRKSNGKSKILATSRVGIGEMSYPFKLSPLGVNDAVQLLRATARVRRVPDIYQAKAEILRNYVQQMKLNAGFIKWFVSSVQCGKRPDQALSNPKTFLDFCLSNVYEHLTQTSRLICKAMISVPGRHSLALISYLSGLSGDPLQEALAGLQSANILNMMSVLTDAGAETVFELNELPRLYILRNHPPSAGEDISFKSRKAEVTKLYERVQADGTGNRYNMKFIACRNPADAITGRLLSEALGLCAAHDFDGARRQIEQARELDPSFYEVYRVEGVVEAFADRPAAAEEAYKNAIAFEPNSAAIRFWYAGFLLRYSQDATAARRELLVAEKLDPEAPPVLIELARSEMFLGQFDDCDRRLERVFANLDASTKHERVAYDTWLQVSIRKAILALGDGRYSDSLVACQNLLVRFRAIPPEFLDERIVATAKRALGTLAQLLDTLSFSSLRPEAENCYREIESISYDAIQGMELPFATAAPEIIPLDIDDIGQTFSGVVERVNVVKRYGFLSFGQRRIFFHFSELPQEISLPAVGTHFTFEVADRTGRFCAVHLNLTDAPIELLETPLSSTRPDAALPGHKIEKRGIIKSLVPEKSFGFITSSGGEDFFFHKSNIFPGVSFGALRVGEAVAFAIGRNHKGVVAIEVKPNDD